MPLRKFILTGFLIVAFKGTSTTQSDTLMRETIDSIKISVLRIPSSMLRSTMSLSHLMFRPSLDQGVSLQENLTRVPGVFSMNANNAAQDLRISIRGFGARSAFGIRGIKLLVDGIPETTPDGQGQIDNLNLFSLEKIEVIRGPASVLHGNASGGVIALHSSSEFVVNKASVMMGSHGLRQFNATTGFETRDFGLSASFSDIKRRGFRDHSAFKSRQVTGRMKFEPMNKLRTEAAVSYTDSPVAEDPGGLTSDQVRTERSQARDANLLYNAGEMIRHFSSRLKISVDMSENVAADGYVFYANRDFSGRLPFSNGGGIDLQRKYWGQGMHVTRKHIAPSSIWTILAGYDMAFQNDHRKRFNLNIENEDRGPLVLDQKESFRTLGAYGLMKWQSKKLSVDLGLRFDWHDLGVDDFFILDGDASDAIDLDALSPGAGMNYQISHGVYVYSSLRTSFETPALSELSADPLGGGGFNTDLKPQKATNIELGMKGNKLGKIDFDLVAFHINTTNDLVPFELENAPGRVFYQNAGSTRRTGVEAQLSYHFDQNTQCSGYLSFARMAYKEFSVDGIDYSDNLLPGIPQVFGGISLYRKVYKGFNFSADVFARNHLYTSDANTEFDAGYFNVDIKMGYILPVKKIELNFFGGLTNIFSASYNDNIRINAFGGRFYEPAPARQGYIAVQIELK